MACPVGPEATSITTPAEMFREEAKSSIESEPQTVLSPCGGLTGDSLAGRAVAAVTCQSPTVDTTPD